MGLGRGDIRWGQESLALAGGGDAIARVQVTWGSSHDTRPSVRSILRSEAYPNDMSFRELQIILVRLQNSFVKQKKTNKA
jgi:hypothetical protein